MTKYQSNKKGEKFNQEIGDGELQILRGTNRFWNNHFDDYFLESTELSTLLCSPYKGEGKIFLAPFLSLYSNAT